MAGHSKWKNIMHKKSKTDAKRAKVFTKIGREIMIAVRQGGSDPNLNSRLYDVVAKAKANNMPNDNIKRSIDKAAGNVDSANYEENTYEGYGPGGVAVIVETLTDNKNRTAGEIRHYFDKCGGNLGTPGCVSFMFEKKGVIMIERNDSSDEEKLMMQSLEAGASDFNAEEEYFEILTDPNEFSMICKTLENDGLEFIEAEIQWVPTTTASLTDEETIAKMDKLIDLLEDNDDVQNVWHNLDD